MPIFNREYIFKGLFSIAMLVYRSAILQSDCDAIFLFTHQIFSSPLYDFIF